MSSISKVYYQGALRTRNMHIRSGEVILTDAPTDNNGKGQAFSPTDLVATSTANCMLTIMGIFASERGFKIEGTYAEVQKEMASNPRRINRIGIDIYYPSLNIDDKLISLMEKAALNCPVIKSLSPEIEKDINFHKK